MANAGEVCGALVATVSMDATARRNAEAYLKKLETDPGLAVLLLQLVQQHSAQQQQESAVIRAAASVYFKNVVKRCWVVSADDDETKGSSPSKQLPDTAKEAIKQHMVKLVCECRHPEVMKQLSDALSIMSAADFPAKWPSLLPEVTTQLQQSQDLQILSGMLLTANSIMKRFRFVVKSDALYAELKYVLDTFAAPLTATFQNLANHLAQLGATAGKAHVETILECLRLCCRVFFSLNWQDLPEYFEDHMAEWMTGFEKYLALATLPEDDPLKRAVAAFLPKGPPATESKKPVDDDDDDDEREGPIEKLQAAIVENVSLYASKYEEEFQPYLQRFAAAIWTRLMTTSQKPKDDHLAVTSIKFLSNVVGNAVHAANFGDETTLQNIIEAIVVPNLMLRDSDVDQFEENPKEYVSRDLEAADAETRRRSARELVQAMCKHHDAVTTKICLAHATTLLGRSDWRSKDAFFHLVVALVVRAETQRGGVSRVSTAVDVADIFQRHVLPELKSTMSHAVVVADAIQFAATFRNQLPDTVAADLVPVLAGANGLLSPKVVVHTYAAYCLERLLHARKLQRAHVEPHLTALFEALFIVIDAPAADAAAPADGTSSSWENEYSMRLVMRLLVLADSAIAPVAKVVTDKLTKALARVCANPRNPKFNHYLFESLAVLVRIVCGAPTNLQQREAAATDFEAVLFPPFQSVLQMDVVEFAPYVFQILALLLSYKTSISQAYGTLLPPLLHPSLWERRGNVPALAQLLEAYLAIGADIIVERQSLEPMLGVFQKLLASKLHEPHAFALLVALYLRIKAEALEVYLPTIFQLLLTRLQHHRDRASLVHKFLAFCGLVAGKRGPDYLVSAIDGAAASPGVAAQLVQHVIIPGIITTPVFASRRDAKHAAVGLTRILCELNPDAMFPGLSQAPSRDAASGSSFTTAIASLLGLVKANDTASLVTHNGNGNDDDAHFDKADYDAAFSQLSFGAKPAQDDAFANIPDLPAFVQTNLTNLANSRPQLQPLVQAAHSAPPAHPKLDTTRH